MQLVALTGVAPARIGIQPGLSRSRLLFRHSAMKLVGETGLAPARLSAPVSKTGVYSFHHSPEWEGMSYEERSMKDGFAVALRTSYLIIHPSYLKKMETRRGIAPRASGLQPEPFACSVAGRVGERTEFRNQRSDCEALTSVFWFLTSAR